MTRRKSKRELEHALDDLGGGEPGTVRAWATDHLDDTLREGEDVEFVVVAPDGDVIEEPDRSGQVCIAKTHGGAGMEFWLDAEDVPGWVDVEKDLPVRA